MAVLDAVLHVAAVDPRVIGAQLGEQQGGVGVALVEDGQGGAEAVVLAYLHPVPSGYQDLCLPALGDEGPLDPGGSQHRAAPGCAGGGQGTEVGDEAGDGDVTRQHGIQGRVARDGDLQSLEVLWWEKRGAMRGTATGAPTADPHPDPHPAPVGAGSSTGDDAVLPVPSPGPNTSGTTVGTNTQSSSSGRAEAMLCPARGRKNHQLCLQSEEASKISLPCRGGRG